MQSDNPVEHAEELIARGKSAEAAALLRELLANGRGGLLARLTLIRALRDAGDHSAALAVAREAVILNPDAVVAAVALGESLLATGRLPTAIGEFQRALRLDPGSVPARYGLGCAWLEAGEPEKAIEVFAPIEHDAEAKKRMAEAEALRSQPRSNPRYVRHLFDQFAVDYDERMIGQLGYRGPAILRELFDLTVAQSELSVLDLGCGTGLSGVAFRDVAARLDGVDLSPAMISKARARGIYDNLRIGDIESLDGRYDLVIAADTLVYLGDLAPLFANVARVLNPAGSFLFTVESKSGEGFELGPKRRWRHSESYLRDLSARCGFEISGFVACVPRNEKGVAVEGYAVALTKRDGNA